LALCIKGILFYDRDISLRVLEWLLILQEQGYSHVYLYIYSVHPNLLKVLRSVMYIKLVMKWSCINIFIFNVHEDTLKTWTFCQWSNSQCPIDFLLEIQAMKLSFYRQNTGLFQSFFSMSPGKTVITGK